MIGVMDARTSKLYRAALIARSQYQIGAINRDEAMKAIMAYLNHANAKGKKIAKSHGVAFKPISPWGFLR